MKKASWCSLVFILSLFCSQSSQAYSITNKSKNPAVKEYLVSDFSEDVTSIQSLVAKALFIEVNFDRLKITISDANEQTSSNGSYDGIFQTLAVSLPPKANKLQLRQTLIHELGHHVFHTYGEKYNRAYQSYLEVGRWLKTNEMPDFQTQDEMDEWFKIENEKSAWFSTVHRMITPFNELFADYLRVLILKEPGQGAHRDFSLLSSSEAPTTTGDVYEVFNSVRALAWDKRLRLILNHEKRAADFLKSQNQLINQRMLENFSYYSDSCKCIPTDWYEEIDVLGAF